MKYSTTTAALAAALTIALPHAARAQMTLPPVPDTLQVEAGHEPFLIGHASGTQNYVCLLSPGGFSWLFYGPQATLFGDDNEQIATHFLSPNPTENGVARATWQHSDDTSSVWALAIKTSTDPAWVAPGAIPWLLLQVVGARNGPSDGSALSDTTFIQRVNTAGGTAPATGCKSAEDAGKKALVPYTTDYVFYREQ
jgi:hypothetical protein